MCQGETPKWWGTLSCCLEVDWSKTLEIRKESISLKEGIVVNFSNNHDNYYSAYRYICKDDDSVHHSKHHPNLDDVASPRTKKSTQAYQQARKSYAQENPTDAPQKKKQKGTSRKRHT